MVKVTDSESSSSKEEETYKKKKYIGKRRDLTLYPSIL
jgi:hypothetical protein